MTDDSFTAAFEQLFTTSDVDGEADQWAEIIGAEKVVELLRQAAELNLQSAADNQDDEQLVAAYREHAELCTAAADRLAGVVSPQGDLFEGPPCPT
jgi:hypothetical protein